MLKIAQIDDWTPALAIRRAVFIDEQGVSAADEVDGRDPDCFHWLACDAHGPVATLRVLPKGDAAKIQRVAVLARARGTGLGAALMRHVMSDLSSLGYRTAVLGSQTDAIGFYERLGFTAHGPIYDDAGLPHRDMIRPL
ncbi:MAG: GNAT family N-acetyltransferase [Pseudomonadota bacterium]